MVQRSSWRTAGLFIVGCLTLGFLSSYLGGAFKKQDWYDNTPKPKIWPPQWVFPVVWIANYTFMGLALGKVWEQRHQASIKGPLGFFALHFLHNLSFIPIVYHFKKRSVYVLMDTIGLVSGLVTTMSFAHVSKKAQQLMLPYMVWLFFTTSIKGMWWRMQRKSR